MSGTLPPPLPSLTIITPNDLISLALKETGKLGVGQTANAEDVTDVYKRLNGMLAIWARKRWLVWALEDHGLTSTGAQSYTIGPGGDFDIPRPARLADAYVRQFVQSGPQYEIDYPIQILESREDYDRIGLKGLTSFPRFAYYQSDFPLASVYFWPIPQATLYEPHIVVQTQLAQFTGLAQPIALPPEYVEAIMLNLCIRIAPMFGVEPNPVTVGLAKSALETVRNANMQMPTAIMPAHLMRGSLYNILSDTVY